jgi:hypothetical protein
VGYQVILAGTPEASADSGVIKVKYGALNSGDDETGGTWDKVVITHEDGSHVYDSSAQVNSIAAGDTHEGTIEQLQAVPAGTYNVSLVLDAEGSAQTVWSSQVTVS